MNDDSHDEYDVRRFPLYPEETETPLKKKSPQPDIEEEHKNMIIAKRPPEEETGFDITDKKESHKGSDKRGKSTDRRK